MRTEGRYSTESQMARKSLQAAKNVGNDAVHVDVEPKLKKIIIGQLKCERKMFRQRLKSTRNYY